jgi:hypothetical protein
MDSFRKKIQHGKILNFFKNVRKRITIVHEWTNFAVKARENPKKWNWYIFCYKNFPPFSLRGERVKFGG